MITWRSIRAIFCVVSSIRTAADSKTRVATDGTRNANSMLYAAAARLAKEAGYEKIITYTLVEEESGASLKAAGWVCIATTEPHQWHNHSRSRKYNPLYDLRKYRWECALNNTFPFERIAFPAERTWQGELGVLR